MGYDPLISAIRDLRDQALVIEWDTGLKIIGKLDTLFETDNGFDEDDANYIEYHAVAFEVQEILIHPLIEESTVYTWLIQKMGSLIEISLYDDPPIMIFSEDGQCVWKYAEWSI